jgi:PAS domain S-box-containing protein/diguanylate cyclase (GGDEF)-like protein
MSMNAPLDTPNSESLPRHVLQQVVSSVSEGIVLVDAADPGLRIVYANPAYERQSGYSADELAGSSWQLATRDDDGSPEQKALREALRCAQTCEITIPDVRKDGTTWFAEVSVQPLSNARGELGYFLCRHRPAVAGNPLTEGANLEIDLLQRELGHARQRIANLASTDAVTGLLSYHHFVSLLDRDLAVARREQRTIAILLFEVVELDVYRQTFGANAADSCLRMIGVQIAAAFRRAGDLCARYDGASLIVVATRGQDEAQLDQLASRVADKVRGLGLHNPHARSGRYLTVRSTAVFAPPGADGAETLIDRARLKLSGSLGPGEKRRASH